jgi:hypothetical protein
MFSISSKVLWSRRRTEREASRLSVRSVVALAPADGCVCVDAQAKGQPLIDHSRTVCRVGRIARKPLDLEPVAPSASIVELLLTVYDLLCTCIWIN